MTRKRFNLPAVIAWFLCGAACLVTLISLGILLRQHGQSENPLKLVGDITGAIYPVPFSITAALILSRQRGNVIGWLLMGPVLVSIIGTPVNNVLTGMIAPPTHPGFLFLLMVWFSNWDWLLLVFPVILIPILFPTGRPPTARWRWTLILAGGLCAIFFFFTFGKRMGLVDSNWSVSNPIGFLDDSLIQTLIVPWQLGLIILTALSAASIFVRYRRAGHVERQQIKWLLYACGIFALIYITGFWLNNAASANFQFLFNLSLFIFPISIAIAILRYRVWDIDILIRRTLLYGALTVAFASLDFGIVLLLGQVFRSITGQDSPVVVVLSTLTIAGLFNPLRWRFQAVIDRRFYRQKYDAAQTLETFSAAVRSEVNLVDLSVRLENVVDETMQPEVISLWLRKDRR